MMQEEWIVEVDTKDQLVSKVDRNVAHDKNELRLHREVMTLLFTDPSHRQFLLQHRSMKKKQQPGLWTLSVTGHVDFVDMSSSDSDGYIAAAKRETFEEIGVTTQNLRLEGKIELKISDNWSMMGIVVGEYEGKLKLDVEEVSEIREFTKDTIAQVSDKLTPGAKACLEYLGILE